MHKVFCQSVRLKVIGWHGLLLRRMRVPKLCSCWAMDACLIPTNVEQLPVLCVCLVRHKWVPQTTLLKCCSPVNKQIRSCVDTPHSRLIELETARRRGTQFEVLNVKCHVISTIVNFESKWGCFYCSESPTRQWTGSVGKESNWCFLYLHSCNWEHQLINTIAYTYWKCSWISEYRPA